MTEKDNTIWLDKVYSAASYEELSAGYDGWAETYDKDVLSFGYLIPAVLSGYVGLHVPAGNTPILDAGAGTGLLGQILSLVGYENLVGIDLSQGMLDVAEKKKAYKKLRQMELGKPLDFSDDEFATVISGGVFTQGHAPADSFDELLRVTQPGGYIIFSARTDVYANEGLTQKLDSLEKAGLWKLVQKTPNFHSLPIGEPEVMGQVFVYQKTA